MCVTQCAAQILKLGSIARFLGKALDPPAEKAVSLAIKNLVDLVRVQSLSLGIKVMEASSPCWECVCVCVFCVRMRWTMQRI